jgi:trehalose-6-phosphate synthase
MKIEKIEKYRIQVFQKIATDMLESDLSDFTDRQYFLNLLSLCSDTTSMEKLKTIENNEKINFI